LSSEPILPGTEAYRRVNIGLFLGGFATFSLLYCTQPILPLLAADFKVSPTASSLALSLTAAALAPAIFLAAAISERFGRRKVMAVSLLAASCCNIAAALSTDWTLLLLARAIEGIALGGMPAVAMTYLAEEIAPASLGRAMGLFIGGSALGGMSGRTITGIVTEWMGWHDALFAIGVLALVFSVCFALLLPRERQFRRHHDLSAKAHIGAWAGHIGHGGMPLLFVIGGLGLGSFVTVYNYAGFRFAAPPYNLSQGEAGLIFLVYLVGVISSPLTGRLADRFGRAPALLGAVLFALSGILLTLAAPLPLVILGIALLTGGFFAMHAVASAWVGRMAARAKGHATSLYLLVYYLGSAVMGSAGGWFWSHEGWQGIAAFTGSALVVAALLAVRLRRFD